MLSSSNSYFLSSPNVSVASNIKFSKLLSQVFFSSSSFHISLRIWISSSSSLFFFLRSFRLYYKNENFRSALRTNGEWWSTLQSADGTGFQRREDAWCIRHARRYNATISHEVAEGKRGKKSDDAKIGVTSVTGPVVWSCATVLYPVHYPPYLARREHLRHSVNMPLRCILRIDVVCGGWNPISNFCLIQNRDNYNII